jgi:hypothetical protein
MTAPFRIEFGQLSHTQFADAHARSKSSINAETVQRVLDAILIGTTLSGRSSAGVSMPSAGTAMKEAIDSAGRDATLYNIEPKRPVISIEPSQDSAKRQGRFSHR